MLGAIELVLEVVQLDWGIAVRRILDRVVVEIVVELLWVRWSTWGLRLGDVRVGGLDILLVGFSLLELGWCLVVVVFVDLWLNTIQILIFPLNLLVLDILSTWIHSSNKNCIILSTTLLPCLSPHSFYQMLKSDSLLLFGLLDWEQAPWALVGNFQQRLILVDDLGLCWLLVVLSLCLLYFFVFTLLFEHLDFL